MKALIPTPLAGGGSSAGGGEADTAVKLSSARTFELTGDVTGTVNSDLETGASIATAIGSGVIVDGDVNASAAIAGSKISPDFGSQTVQTTGPVIVGKLGAGGANYGTAGQVLTSNGADAAPSWGDAAAAGGSVAGSNTQIQYNDSGSFGASADLAWDDSTKLLDVGGAVLLDKLGAGGANYGTSGQVLTSQGSGSPVQWASLPASLALTSSTVTASGTGNTFGSLPSGLRRVNLTFNGLSTSLGVRIGVRIGGSGGLVTTGYNLASCFFGGGYNGFFNTNDSLFGATGWADASNIYNGKVEITRHSSTATASDVIYFLQLTLNLSGFNYIHIVQGHVTLPTELTQVRLMPESGNFDAGSIEIDYLS